MTDVDGQTLFFKTKAGAKTGNHNLKFLRPDEVPAFEGAVGWFEVECVRNGGRIAKVLRQVDAPSTT